MKRLLMIFFTITSVVVAFAATPTVSNVTAKQRYPWNGMVDITYTVSGNVVMLKPDSLSVTAIDNANGTNYTAATVALTGDTGTAAGAHHIVWDLNEQGIEFKSSNVIFTVIYTTIPMYCVIDLSAGANATNYPVAYMDSPPSGGFNTDEYKTTKLVLRLIEPGTFMMCGQYKVTLTKPFYCGIFEVTQRQYELVTDQRPSFFNNISYYATRPVELVSWNMIRGDSSTYNWPGSVNVDPDSFMGKIQARTGLNFDLPTEAQWEYACRAGMTSNYNNGGSNESDLAQLGRYWDNGGSGYSQSCTIANGTAKVGAYQLNAWGLYDMHGNVWEWCLDWFGELSGDVTDPVGSSSGSCRVARGGGWGNYATYCTSSYRSDGNPAYKYKYDGSGFRLVRTLSNQQK